MGRHREFDADTALAAALNVFWKKGFEGTSLSDLTEAMTITRPSLYAAFGNKEALFRKALDRYQNTCMSFLEGVLAKPTARAVAEGFLQGFADVATGGEHPPGCLGTTGALACSEEAEPIRQELIRRREALELQLRTRLEAAVGQGDLPADAEAAELSCYLMAVAQGMGVQAVSGADRTMLHAVVRNAMRAWPGTN